MVSKLLNFWTMGTIIFLKGPNHKHLTSADPLQSGGAGAEIAFQPLGVVAGLHFAAVLVELLGADLAAATAVPDQPNSRGALGHLQGAVAGGGAGGERLEAGEEMDEPRCGEQEKLPRERKRVSDSIDWESRICAALAATPAAAPTKRPRQVFWGFKETATFKRFRSF